MIYLAKEHLLTMFTFCFLSSLTRSALRGPRRCCLLRKTVPLVPHKFPISLVSHQIFYPPDSNHIVNIFPTSSSPLSCIRFIRIKSTWYRRAHQLKTLPSIRFWLSFWPVNTCLFVCLFCCKNSTNVLMRC